MAAIALSIRHFYQFLEPLPQSLAPSRGGDAAKLALGPRRVGKRAVELEDLLGAKIDPRGPNTPHRVMMRGYEYDAAALFFDAAADLLRYKIDLHAQRR